MTEKIDKQDAAREQVPTWARLDVPQTQLDNLRKVLNKIDPHEHYDGQNECMRCEEPILDAARRLLDMTWHELTAASAALAEERADNEATHELLDYTANMAKRLLEERDALALAIGEFRQRAEEVCNRKAAQLSYGSGYACKIVAEEIRALPSPSREHGEALLRELEQLREQLGK